MTIQQHTAVTDALGVGTGELVALVGGGGKTTLMQRVTSELRARGVRAAAATTTKIRPPGADSDGYLVTGDRVERLAGAVLPDATRYPVFGRRLLRDDKVEGVPPAWCSELLRRRVCETLVVEADGSAGRPLKAPETWEPAVPGGTSLFVAVVGLSCLGRVLDEAAVHRLHRVIAVADAQAGDVISAGLVCRVLAAADGLGKGRPATARAVAFLNQLDVLSDLQPAIEIVEFLLAERDGPFDAVVAGSLRAPGRRFHVWTP